MKLIIITSPDFIPDEASIVTELFKAGLDLLHVRKPDDGNSSEFRLKDTYLSKRRNHE